MILHQIETIPKLSWIKTKDNIFQKTFVYKNYEICLDRSSRNKPFIVSLYVGKKGEGIKERVCYGQGKDYFFQLLHFISDGVWSENIHRIKI